MRSPSPCFFRSPVRPNRLQIPSTEIAAPPQNNLPHDAPLNPKLPTIFIVGDSTARNGANLGWGDHFAALFDTSKVNVANRAVAGRSSRSYYNEGKWAAVLSRDQARRLRPAADGT